MKTSRLMLAAALVMGASTMYAQTDEQKAVMCSNENDAVTNYSLYYELAAQKKPEAYVAAYEFWRPLYDAVPNFNANIYIHGEQILMAMRNKAIQDKNMDLAKQLGEDLLALYDNRIANGFTTAKFPAPVIRAKKADMYLKLNGKGADQQKAYQMFSEAIGELKGDAEPYYIGQWVDLSLSNFKGNPELKNQYLDDYMKSTEYLDDALDRYVVRYEKDTAAINAGQATAAIQKDAPIAQKLIEQSRAKKMELTQKFATSGVADVQTLVDIFAPQVETRKTDLAFLNNVSKLLGRSKEGRETELYTTCADYSYQIQPSMEAAKGLAQAALKKKDYDRAIEYYEEALGRAIQPDDKCEILLYEAAIYQETGSKAKSREVLRKSLSIDPNQDTPHVMIANLYATSANQCGEEKPALKSLVYVAAYNELQQAVANASSDEKKAQYQRSMAAYKSGFPSKGDIFMQAGKGPGDSHTLGGWMNVTVTVQVQ